MVANDFLDDEFEEFTRELGIQIRLAGQILQPLDFLRLPLRIARREIMFRLELPTACVCLNRSANV